MAKFDIVLPIYNVEQYLSRCIDSILAQKYKDYRIILVDDGSTDRSAQLCDEYARKYPFIEVIHKENGGLSSARNAGLAMCNGEYVFFIDSDDWISQDALQVIADRVEKAHPDILKFNYYRHIDGCIELARGIATQDSYIGRSQTERLMLMALDNPGAFLFTAWSHVYRIEFLKKNCIEFVSEREIGSEDFLFNYQAYAVSDKIIIINDALYYYDLRSGSLSQKYISNLPEKYEKLYNLLKTFVLKNDLADKYMTAIERSYGWSYVRIIIGHEYREMPGHCMTDARKNVKALLKKDDLQKAIRIMWREKCPVTQRVILLCIRGRMEWALHFIYTRKG